MFNRKPDRILMKSIMCKVEYEKIISLKIPYNNKEYAVSLKLCKILITANQEK